MALEQAGDPRAEAVEQLTEVVACRFTGRRHVYGCPRAPVLPGFRGAESLSKDYVAARGQIGTSRDIFRENRGRPLLAVGIDRPAVVALRRGRGRRRAIRVDLTSVLQTVGIDRPVVVALRRSRRRRRAVRVDRPAVLPMRSRSEDLQEEVPEAAGEESPPWTRDGWEDRSAGGGDRGEEEPEGQNGCDHEPGRGFPGHTRTLSGQATGAASSGPPRLPFLPIV